MNNAAAVLFLFTGMALTIGEPGALNIEIYTSDSLANKPDSPQPPVADSTGLADQTSPVSDTASLPVPPPASLAPIKPKETHKKPLFLLKANGDTTLILLENDVRRFVSDMKETIDKSRVQGYGGAGGLTPRVMFVKMKPVNTLAKRDTELRDINNNQIQFPSLNDGYTMIPGTGGIGYGGIGDGIRIGGGGWGGTTSFASDTYQDSINGSIVDAWCRINVEIGFGGFLVEKAFVHGKWNHFSGFMMSFGNITVKKESWKVGNASAFSGGSNNGSDNAEASARFMGLDSYLGATYTVVPWMHIGGDANLMFAYSNEGFGKQGTEAFYGAYPGLRIRIIFGNLG